MQLSITPSNSLYRTRAIKNQSFKGISPASQSSYKRGVTNLGETALQRVKDSKYTQPVLMGTATISSWPIMWGLLEVINKFSGN